MIFKKVIKYEMRVLILSTTFVRAISHFKKTEQDVIKNVYCSSSEVTLYSCQIFNEI
jgi:hypothetical protein